MIKLVEKEKPEGIWVGDMEEGDVGVVVSWSSDNYLNYVVQRCKNDLIIFGAITYWKNIFEDHSCQFTKLCRVRLLKKGEMLIVT